MLLCFCSVFCHFNREMRKGEQMESSLHACNWYQSPTAHQREQSLRGKGRGGGGGRVLKYLEKCARGLEYAAERRTQFFPIR